MRKQAASPLLAGSAPQDWLGWDSGSRGRPFPQQTQGACAIPSPCSAAAPTGLRMRPRSSQPAARPRLQPRGTAGANRGCQRRPGAPPWSSEASAPSEQTGPAAQAAGNCGSAPRAAHRPARRADYKSHEALRPCWRRLGVGRAARRASFVRERTPPRALPQTQPHSTPGKKINKHLFDTVIFNTYS